MSQRPADWTAWLNVEGCGFVVVTALLLVMNAMVLHLICTNLLAHLLEQSVREPAIRAKVVQAVLLIGSVLFVFVQWWIIERLTARWFPRRGKEPDPAAEAEARDAGDKR